MPSTATITAFYSFTAGQKIKSAEHNNNFSAFRGHIIAVDPTAAALVNNTYDLGSTDYKWRAGHINQVNAVTVSASSIVTTTLTATTIVTTSLSSTSPIGVASGGTSFSGYTKGDLIVADSSTTLTKLNSSTDTKVLTGSSAASSGLTYAYPYSEAFSSRSSVLSITSGTVKITGFTNDYAYGAISWDNANQKFVVNTACATKIDIYCESAIFDGSLSIGIKVNTSTASFMEVTLVAGQAAASGTYLPFRGMLALNAASGDAIEVWYSSGLTRDVRDFRVSVSARG